MVSCSGAARARFDVLLHRQRGRGFLLVVHVVDVGGFRNRTATASRGVSGGDVHVVRDALQVAVGVGARLEEAAQQGLGAHHVGHEGLIDGWVEGHVARAVHQNIDVAGQLGDFRQIAFDHLDALRHQRLDAAGGLDDFFEDLLAQQLLHALLRGERALAAHEHRGGGVWAIAEETPQHLLADETGDAGHRDLLTREQVGNTTVQQRRRVPSAGLAERRSRRVNHPWTPLGPPAARLRG